jgi:hypothetical protein
MYVTNKERNSRSFGARSFLFAAVLAFLFYLLASNMVTHHFFRGGSPDPKTLPTQNPIDTAR